MRRELTNQFRATNNEIASVRGAACWWMTGSYTGCNKGFTAEYEHFVPYGKAYAYAMTN